MGAATYGTLEANQFASPRALQDRRQASTRYLDDALSSTQLLLQVLSPSPASPSPPTTPRQGLQGRGPAPAPEDPDARRQRPQQSLPVTPQQGRTPVRLLPSLSCPPELAHQEEAEKPCPSVGPGLAHQEEAEVPHPSSGRGSLADSSRDEEVNSSAHVQLPSLHPPKRAWALARKRYRPEFGSGASFEAFLVNPSAIGC